MKKKTVLLIILSLLLLTGHSGTLSAAGTRPVSAQSPTEISFWHSMGGVMGVTLEGIVQNFNDTVGAEKGISIKTVYQGKNLELAKKLKAAVQANDTDSMPDLTLMSSGETGYMLNLEIAVKAEDIFNDNLIGLSQDDFLPGAVKALSYQDKAVGLPFAPSSLVMYYNRDAFIAADLDPDTPPKTIAELAEVSKKLTIEENGQISQYGFGLVMDSWHMASWIGQQNHDGNGYSLFGDNDNGHADQMTKVVFDENGTMQHFLEIYTAAAKEGNFKYKDDDLVNNFIAGNVTITLHSSSMLPGLLKDTAGNFELGVAAIPMVDENSTGGVSFGGSAIYPMNLGDENNFNAALEFLKFFYLPEQQVTWQAGSGYLPAVKSAFESEAYKSFVAENPFYNVAPAQVLASNPNIQEPMVGVGTTILVILKDGIAEVLDGNMSIEEGVAEMADQCNIAIEEYNDAN